MDWTKEFEGTRYEFEVREVAEGETTRQRKGRWSQEWVERAPRCARMRHDSRVGENCNRAATHVIRKEDGAREEFVCKQHLAGERRRRKNDMAKDLEAHQARRQRENLDLRLAALSERIGVKVEKRFTQGYGSQMGSYSNYDATVRIGDLEVLAKRLEEVR